ncbi:hypothetical protein Tco_0664701 [Tanacetum coccineum]
MIIAGLAESKKDHAIELFAKLEVGMDELQTIAGDRKREVVAPKQKELLQYVVLNYANVDIHDPDVRDHEPISHYLAKPKPARPIVFSGCVKGCGLLFGPDQASTKKFVAAAAQPSGENFRGRRKKQRKEVTGEEEIQQTFRAEVLVFIKDMDKDTGILMGSRVLDVRRLPDKVGCSGRRRRQASLLFLKTTKGFV